MLSIKSGFSQKKNWNEGGKQKTVSGERKHEYKNQEERILNQNIYMYKYISVFKLHILSQKNYTKHNV